jgi:hypothetical protein
MALRYRAIIGERLLKRGIRRRVFGVFVLTSLSVVLIAGAGAFADIPDRDGLHACYEKDSGRLRVVDNESCHQDERKLIWNVKGPEGPRGERGPAGPNGDIGRIGPEGPAGPAGAVGPQGPAGPEGQPGPQGLVGPDGAVGPEGPSGPRGPSGPPGTEGPAGSEGPRGPAGISGFEMVTARTPVSGFNSESPKQASAHCPRGKRVVGTGANVEGGNGELDGRVALQEIVPVSASEARSVAAEVSPGTNAKWAIVAVAFCAETPSDLTDR